jgi:dTDP-4-amino-4,6-dideoxygalactose transaminase
MHLQPVFASADYYGGKVAENLFAQGLCLPSGSNLTTSDLDRVIDIIRRVMR